jgi:L-glutamine:scyllo-inosose aminotransferase/L-glutamine:2-deoxy-scyllo-inosose/3-amino-2,3-dideoxy-scyllo-inosose aminotransferase
MCPKKTRAAITRKTRAIMLVHPFCRNADLNEFLKISNETGIPIVEDCSQAHGAKWNGARVGSLGVMGCFSMQQSKVLTSGEGGAVITNRADLYRKLEQLRADGRIFSEAPEFGRLELIEVGEVQGQNFCLSEFQSALLLDRLPHLDEQNARRHEFSKRLCARLEDEGLAKSLPPNDERHQNAYYNLVLEPDLEKFQGCSIDAIAQALTAELCVQISPIYRPMNQHRLYCPLRSPKVRSESQKADVSPTRFALPEAQRARAKFLTLPNWMLLSDDSGIEAIAAAFAKVSSLKEKLMSSDQPETAAAF